ncbi:MAG TPA: hypothetical protein VLY04_15715 [Bryobacteraceae bacterium]|nr:hypothetical protein [Bryobacteraceae bacterium]
MRLRFTISILLAAIWVMMAAESPFVGKWKLNPAKSQFAGTTTTYEQLPSGEMQMTAEGQSYKFKVDGKDYAAIFGQTAAWKQLDPNTWEVTNKFDGKVLGTDAVKIAADRKTLTVVSKGKKPNGESYDESAAFERVSGGTGLAGKWKSTKVQPATEMWDIAPNGDDGLTLTVVDYNASAKVKFDGKDYPVTGPTMPKNFTLAIKKTGPRSLEMTEKMDGKAVFIDVFTVSADGKTLIDEASAPGSNEKIKAVYDRQ